MNFYKHHIGDYAQATSHLSFVEDAAFSRLLRKYYAEEKPIPGSLNAAQRLVGARSRDERKAVETVLDEFFMFDGQANIWRNKRAEEELAKATAQAETNRRIAEQREALRRLRTRDTQSTDCAQDSHDSSHDPSTKRQPSQTPDSRLHILRAEDQSAAHAPNRPRARTEVGRACMLLRQAGCMRINPSCPSLGAAFEEGVTPEAIRDAYLERPDATNPFAWAIATARGRQADGAKAVSIRGTTPITRTASASKTLKAIQELEEMKNDTQLDQTRDQHRLAEDGPA
jgi:uncharacterized protein YdaU (DUF1376 family)